MRTSSRSSTRKTVPRKLGCTLRLGRRGAVLHNAFPSPLSFASVPRLRHNDQLPLSRWLRLLKPDCKYVCGCAGYDAQIGQFSVSHGIERRGASEYGLGISWWFSWYAVDRQRTFFSLLSPPLSIKRPDAGSHRCEAMVLVIRVPWPCFSRRVTPCPELQQMKSLD